MRIGIIIGIVIASYAPSASADDKGETETTAYCIGVHQRDIEGWKAGISKGSKLEKTSLKELELRKLRKEAELTQAIRRRTIEYVIAARITENGYEDSKMCSQIGKCTIDATKRIETKVDQAINDAMTKECQKPFEPACERAYKKCD